MNYNDLSRLYRQRERKTNEKDNEIAKKVLLEFSKKHNLLHPITGNYIEDLLYNYFLVKNTPIVTELETLMNKYNFNYAMSIHNAIYYLLGMKQDTVLLDSNPLLWPGIESVKQDDNIYVLKTVLGEIKVSKASKIFENTSVEYIFNKPLMGKCYRRSYDFVKEKQENYDVVLSYMPNFFYGGHYHAYLESDDAILDIAGNSYYHPKEDASKILNGTIIRKLDYKKIEKDYKTLSSRMPELKFIDNPKLLTLALYYDYKDRI